MRFFIRISLLLLMLFSAKAIGQDIIPTYSDYLTDNLYLLHPSMAGAANMNKIRLTARKQWFEVEDAPALQTLSIHARVKEKIGIGGILFNDQNGYYSRRGIYATFAYHLLFSRSELDLNQLSFGISAGFIQHSLDQSDFTESDPLLGDGNASDFYGNIDIGASYYYFNFFAHLTAKNILPISRDLFYSDAIPGNQRKYLFSTGYVVETRKRLWSYEPSIMFQWKEAIGEKTIDINAKVYRELPSGLIFGGLSYRRSFQGVEYTGTGEEKKTQYLQYLTPFVGFEWNRFLFAYTYSQQFNSVILGDSGFHQITLGYNFGENRGRYDCYCPGVNQNRR